jgi:uncharacterized protein (DUF1778 family)
MSRRRRGKNRAERIVNPRVSGARNTLRNKVLLHLDRHRWEKLGPMIELEKPAENNQRLLNAW